MNKVIDDLMNEHRAVLGALHVLKGIASRLEEGQPVGEADISDILGFLKLFADRCHHGKEEGMLFPALVRAGLPQDSGPVGVMLLEHERGRELISAMEESSFPKLEPKRFAAAVHGYVDLLEKHIAKENDILFPLAGQLLTEHQLAEMAEAFDRHEETVVGKGRHEELHAMLSSLHSRYGSP